MEAKKLSETAAAAWFGCSQSMISLVANNKRRPGGRLVARMIQVGIDVSSHLGDSVAS